jgi:hypothetical protein
MTAGMVFAGGRDEGRNAREFVTPSEYGVTLNNLNLDNGLHASTGERKLPL